MNIPKQSASVVREFVESRYGAVILPSNAKGSRPLGGGGGGGSNPPPGCWLSGTECRGWMQKLVYCCPGGTTWKKSSGWCIGWYDAPPCF